VPGDARLLASNAFEQDGRYRTTTAKINDLLRRSESGGHIQFTSRTTSSGISVCPGISRAITTPGSSDRSAEIASGAAQRGALPIDADQDNA
jgi:hypothetical protein